MHVLVPFDGSDPADRALAHALETFPDADITVLYVIDPIPEMYGGDTAFNYERLVEAGEQRAEELFAEATSVADTYDMSLTTETVIGKPVRRIVEYTEENEVDHVVLGSHGRDGFSRFLLGSVAETVVRRSPVPVTVVR